jgi:tetratricopeptide (TPR) repeat protein
MDRIVRVVALTIAVAVAGLAAPAGYSLGNEADGPALAQPAPSPSLKADSPICVDTKTGTVPSPTAPSEAIPRVVRTPPVEAPNAAPAEMPAAEIASPLKTTSPDRERSEQLEQVARQVDCQTRHGFDLAGRGAYFAARSEFLAALRLLTEGLDTDQKTNAHGRALTAALTAMREAEEFLPGESRVKADADLTQVIAAHATPVLKDKKENVTSMAALKCYFTFAQEQFAAAVGNEVAGSMTLYALGKLHDSLAKKKSGLAPAAESKAMVYYQAALLAYPKNFMAANDLGVLLAQCGHCAEARTVLEHSLSLSPQAVTWHNLAVVYAQLGQPALARQADGQAAALQQAELVRRTATLGTVNNTVVWMDRQAFAQTSSNTPSSPGATPPVRQTPEPSAMPARVTPPAQATKTARPPSAAERMSWGSRSYQ